MITSELHDGQGLGNQLWNYAVARIIADKRGCDFSIQGRHNFKGREFMDIDLGKESSKHDAYYKEKTEYLKGTDIDISRTDPALLDLQPFSKFDGNCQSTRYLEGYREKLQEWIALKEEFAQHVTDEDTCIIHFRAGDFRKQKDVFLSREYYLNAMEYVRELNKDVRFCCVTDEPDVARKILPDIEIIGSALAEAQDATIASHHRGGPIGIDFALMMQVRYLIIPNSSFSWWAAYLNKNAVTVIAPKFWARHNVSDGYWSTSDIITDSFTYIDRNGTPFSSVVCWEEKNAYEQAHPDMFSRTPTLSQTSRSIAFGRKAFNFGMVKVKHAFRRIGESTSSLFPYPHIDQKPEIVCDAFIFFNELELLEIRLNILDKHVDRFAIVEATRTFTGKPKPLHYLENKERFKKWEHKITHYIVDDMPSSLEEIRERLKSESLDPIERQILNDTLSAKNIPDEASQWIREFYQKESIKKALVGLGDYDLCYVSDVDEIWNPDAKLDLSKDAIFKMRQKAYAYYLNNRSSEKWSGTFATRYKNIKVSSINKLDVPEENRYLHIPNGGWHFTNIGGADRIRTKLEAYGHQEFNNADIKDDLENKIASNTDFVGRRFRFWTDETKLPEYIINNRQTYKHLFK